MSENHVLSSETKRLVALNEAIRGRTVGKVCADSLNVVRLEFTDGTWVKLGAEDAFHGVPVIGVVGQGRAAKTRRRG